MTQLTRTAALHLKIQKAARAALEIISFTATLKREII
jgi:hypothetical protein